MIIRDGKQVLFEDAFHANGGLYFLEIGVLNVFFYGRSYLREGFSDLLRVRRICCLLCQEPFFNEIDNSLDVIDIQAGNTSV
jgi:hypothetical protein